VIILCAALATALPRAQEHQMHHGAPVDRVGSVHFENSCSPDVAKDIDRGVALLHSFWFDQAIAAFKTVAERDPACGVSQWGVALGMWGNVLAGGPQADGVATAWAAVERGRQMGSKSEREHGYLDAAAALYQNASTSDARARKLAYEQAMANLAKKYPSDTEASVFYGMALVGTHLASDKSYAKLLAAADVLDPLFQKMPDHPGLAHYIIHAYDVPPLAPRAVDAARRYAAIAPDAPHALHMPSHTFTRLGHWRESIESNTASAAAARRAKSPGDELHAYDYLVYAYLQTAHDRDALRVIETGRSVGRAAAAGGLGQGNVAAAPGGGVGAYALTAMPARYVLERGQWTEAAQLQELQGATPAVQAMTLFTRALGLARGGGDLVAARSDLATLVSLQQKLAGNNQAYDAEQVEIQRRSVEAWILHAEGKTAGATALMQTAVAMQDKTEKSAISPGPLAPARELYAEMLLDAGRLLEALEAFEASAQQEPRRFRGVHGAARTAALLGNLAKAQKYYGELVAIAEGGDTPERPELTEAKAYLAKTR